MTIAKVKAIVLGGVNVKEKDKLITVYSLEQGKMVLSLKGVRGDKAKLKMAKEIFTFAEFLIEKGNIVVGADLIDNFYNLSQNFDKYFEGCAILGIVNDISLAQPNSALFIELLKALRCLCYDDVKRYYVINKFLISVFSMLGYSFLGDKCASCHSSFGTRYFDYEVGDLVCSACKNDLCEKLSDEVYASMRLLDKTSYEKLSTLNLRSAREVFNVLCKNFRARVGKEIFRGSN